MTANRCIFLNITATYGRSLYALVSASIAYLHPLRVRFWYNTEWRDKPKLKKMAELDLKNYRNRQRSGMNSFRLWIYRLLISWLPESRGYGFKVALLRWAGAKIGRNVRVYSSARIMGVGELEIGDDMHIGPDVLLYPNPNGAITIGSHVDIGPRATLITGSHEIDPQGEHIGGKGTAAPVVIGSGSWLGANATILPGVTLPSKTLVAAGAVVSKTPPQPQPPTSGLLLAGVPAVVKKNLSP